MPTNMHPQAMFDPLPPDLDITALVEKTPNFDFVIRISTDQIKSVGMAEFEKLVLVHVVHGGKPLIVEGWQGDLPPWLYSSTWLQDNMGKKCESVRDITNQSNIPMTIGHYLQSMGKLTRQWTPTNYRDPKRQRLYLKDIDCPEAWYQQLQDTVPDSLFYLNESVGERGGPGAKAETDRYGESILGQEIAPAGDLMSNLPPEMRAENMMCYIGHEGTYTPAHREMCATLGQNLMVETSDTDKGENDGSSIWFMTETKDREVVSEYFLSMLGHDIEIEKHFAQMVAWKKAPFPVYIVEQKVGDFIIIPPLAPHQVWNRGTRTMKVAWNRTTVETLEMAIQEALPRARMVCRDEQYKCKAIIYYSLLNYYDRLQAAEKADELNYLGYQKEPVRQAPKVRQLQKDFKRLFSLYREILVSEMFSPDLPPKGKDVEFIPFDSNITCSYCRCNIFNRFLTCKTCIGELPDGEEDTYDICMECYSMGRSCACLSNLQWAEQWHWSDLLKNYEAWRLLVINIDGFVDEDSPQSLEVERERSGKKSYAQICQEQLKLRPWRDINKPMVLDPLPGDSDNEPEVDDEGRPKKKRMTKRQAEQLKHKTKTATCHICKKPEANWKLAFCTTCPLAYCYGTLWRAFDTKPEKVMEKPDWQCPKCRHICSCGACRRKGNQIAYQPKGTLLGHDTRGVADPRSVESLVDFGRTNLAWLKGDDGGNPKNTARIKKLMEKAEAEKSRDEVLDEDLDEAGAGQNASFEAQAADNPDDLMAIDPVLWDGHDELENDSLFVSPVAQADSGSPRMDNGTAARPDQPLELQPAVDHHPDGDLQSGNHEFTSPVNLMKETDYLSYPDPSVMGKERMMGIGYYQQQNDADKILFDAPDAAPPTEQQPNIEYPRLQSESEDEQVLRGRKRQKRESVPSAKRRMNEAHLQFMKAQKKQKLATAKKEGNYHMVKGQLEGHKPLKLKLLLPNNKEFLGKIETAAQMGAVTRHNPRPARTSAGNKGGVAEEDTILAATAYNAIQFLDANDGDMDDGGAFPRHNPRPARTSLGNKGDASDDDVVRIADESDEDMDDSHVVRYNPRPARSSLGNKGKIPEEEDGTSVSKSIPNVVLDGRDDAEDTPAEESESGQEDDVIDPEPREETAKPPEFMSMAERRAAQGRKVKIAGPSAKKAAKPLELMSMAERRAAQGRKVKIAGPSTKEKAAESPELMSMAERRAAQGKKVKIVGPRRRVSFQPVNGSSGSHSTGQSSSVGAESKPSVVIPLPDESREQSPTTSSSEDDDDEEIPARRPAGKPGGVMSLSTASRGLGRPRN